MRDAFADVGANEKNVCVGGGKNKMVRSDAKRKPSELRDDVKV